MRWRITCHQHLETRLINRIEARQERAVQVSMPNRLTPRISGGTGSE